MITEQTQIKINLPFALKDFLESKASKYGIPLTAYIKHLIIEDVSDMAYPVFEPSERTIKKALKALKEKDKAIKIDNIEEYFNNL